MMRWADLADGELRARLEQRGVADSEVLVRRRDDHDAAVRIDELLGDDDG